MGKQARFVLVRPAQRRQIVQKDGVVRTGDEHLLNLLVLPFGLEHGLHAAGAIHLWNGARAAVYKDLSDRRVPISCQRTVSSDRGDLGLLPLGVHLRRPRPETANTLARNRRKPMDDVRGCIPNGMDSGDPLQTIQVRHVNALTRQEVLVALGLVHLVRL